MSHAKVGKFNLDTDTIPPPDVLEVPHASPGFPDIDQKLVIITSNAVADSVLRKARVLTSPFTSYQSRRLPQPLLLASTSPLFSASIVLQEISLPSLQII